MEAKKIINKVKMAVKQQRKKLINIRSYLGYQACVEGDIVMYFNTAGLFAKIKMAKADGSYLKELSRIERQHLLIFDDFGLQPLDSQNRMTLLEIIEDRHDKGSVIITSQLPVSGWYEMIGEKTLADSILDRLVHDAHRLEFMGESLGRAINRPAKINELEDEVKIR